MLSKYKALVYDQIAVIEKVVTSELEKAIHCHPYDTSWIIKIGSELSCNKELDTLKLLQQEHVFRAFQERCKIVKWSMFATSRCDEYIVLQFTPIEEEK